ncbi:hypothetical protein MKX01_000024 [Papaver californicum]|nr:hypothetical protein MKX01_000024 [Papaver californicum]
MEQKEVETRIQISNPNNPLDESSQFPSALQQPMLHTQEYPTRHSFRGPDGKFHYGYITPRGLAVFKPNLGVETPKDEKLCFPDFVHALMSVAVFAAIVGGDRRVTHCLLRKLEKEIDEVMESLPLIIGVICSGLYLVFPNTRYGVGCVVT